MDCIYFDLKKQNSELILQLYSYFMNVLFMYSTNIYQIPVLARYHFRPLGYNQKRQVCQDLLLIGCEEGYEAQTPLSPPW